MTESALPNQEMIAELENKDKNYISETQTPNPKPQTPNPKPQTPNPKPLQRKLKYF